jgi:hypothetical protein
VRYLLSAQIGKLAYRYNKTGDAAVKAEIDRLRARACGITGEVEVCQPVKLAMLGVSSRLIEARTMARRIPRDKITVA